ncbi:platelet binding protein GspB isoform X1 [Bactrocera tryoni]|uniref:platelet binding protein GspB isoform X1 n=1 Tax=Bactrocera tryoni TaxID=59916 RepID=UPI001A99ACC4|nr:platelet binding protein GspB isoform X1 [Bactrocera tryoni]
MNNEISGKTLLSVTASIAATIIPDTPIVSIAGATLSEITTTTTSTTTTPTPTPTPTSFIPSNKTNRDHINANLPNNPMSDAAVAKSAGGNGTAAANNTLSNTPADTGGIAGKNSSLEHATIVNIANAGKSDDANTNASTDTKKSDISDLEEPELKKLLDEAYNYKTPKDKKDKSEIFLDLLQKVENEDLGITSTRADSHRHHPHSQSRHQQKQGGSLQDLLQLPSDYRRQNHTSRHKKNSSVSSRQREGGSLPSNVNVANCLLSSFGQQSSVYTDKRVRRGILPGVESATVSLNSNKTLVGVVGLAVSDPNSNCLLSSFEQQTPAYADKPVRRILGLAGGDPNATTGGTGTSGSAGTNSVGICSKDSGSSVGASVTSVIGGTGNMATTASGHSVGGTMATGAGIVNNPVKSANSITGSSDYIINIGDMIDIQQQQQILPSKAQDGGQGLPYYERVDIDMRIPRPNLHRGEGVDFAPAHSHHYVDEVIRFHQIDGGDGSLCESGEVAISVNNLGNKLKSAAASCSLPMPLDERYRSIKSVMGEKGENAGASLNAAVTAKASGTITANSGGSISNSNNNSGGGVGTNSIGIGSYTKSLPLSRQTDENGNDCERQQHNSSSSSITVSAGQSQAKAKTKKKPQKDNTIPVDVENEAGYRGKDPVEVLLKFIEEDSKQSGSGGNKFAENNKKKERKKEKVKQSKMKKSNSLEELRSCAKIDVGELKQSAATTESNNVTMRSKGSGGGKGGKNNSASIADINKNFDGGSKEGTTTSPTSGGKQANAVATNSNTTVSNRKGERRSWGTEELQYLGTEGSVGGAGSNSGSVASSGEDKVKEKKDKKSKEKDKDKERDVEKEKDKGKDKDKEKEKDSDKHDKLTNNKIDGNTKLDKHEKIDKVEKAEKQEKVEKPERADKTEKRKRSESIMQTPIANTVERQDAGTPVFSAIDLLSMNALISETAEFHVVTKKKKPKKQRASIDETHFTQNSNYNNSGHNNYNNNNCGTTSRAHNMVLNAQKNNNNSNNNNNNVSQQQQQQQQSRYKYHNNNAHGFNSYGNGGGGGSGSNNNSFGEDGRLDYRNNYNSNYNNNYNTNHSHQQYGYQHQQQQGPYHHHQHNNQQQQQQHHHHAHNVNSGSTDKSRRKSTSSVPPSEKSDSSDLDSVHSLPIESTTASVTKNKQRHKQTDASTTATPETPKSTASGGSPGSAPISYAHIAAAAAADRWPSLDAANNNNNAMPNGINTSPTIANNMAEQLQTQVTNNCEIATSSSLSNASNSPSTAAAVFAAATNSASKQGKSKKLTIKPDFPELGSSNATIATASDNSKPNLASAAIPVIAAASKTISYSQRLVAAPAQLITQPNIVGIANGEKVAGPTVDAVITSTVAATTAVPDTNTLTDVNKVDIISGISARLPQQQPMQHQQSQQQMQTLQKSKSVEHDNYSFNSSNLDQQYPALEKTVKRHSATNVSISPPTAAATIVGGAVGSSGIPTLAASSVPPANVTSSTKFNFAAAAKQLVVKSCSVSQSILTQDPAIAGAAAQPLTVSSITTSDPPAAYPTVPGNATITAAVNVTVAPVTMPVRKSKEKSPTAVFAPPTAINALATAAVVPIVSANLAVQTPDVSAVIITARKSKKEKSQPVLIADPTISFTTITEPHAHVAQKLSTATQTQATSMDIDTSGKTSRSQSNIVASSETVVIPPIVSKPQRQHVSTATNISKSHIASAATTATNPAYAGAVVGPLSCNAPSNRPAVIILNDDRTGDSSAVGIEFTFGDFNEDELKFFDDNIDEDDCSDELAVNDSAIQQPSQPATAPTLNTGVANSAYTKNAAVPVELANDNIVTPFVENVGLYAAVRASSPQPTFIGPPLSNVPVVKDIGLIVKTPVTAVGNSVNNNTVDQANVNDNSSVVSVAGSDTDLQLQLQLQQQQQQQLQRRNSETQKLQQLETCNDIETAIIAAARAAAEQQHQQPPMQPPPLQQQRSYRHKHQQQYRSTSYGNAYEPPQQREQRSQSAYTRDTPNNYQQQHHYHSQYHQQPHYHYHQSSSSNSASRSRSSSSNNNANSYDVSGSTPPPQSPNPTTSVVVNIQRKEFDIHFIPPTMSNAYNALQHNEIIVDFIGSAWEEVAKVTKFYEGQ